MQGDGIRNPTPHAQHVVLDLDRRKLTAELEDERVDAVVGGEQVRAEADDGDFERPLLRPAKQLLHL